MSDTVGIIGGMGPASTIELMRKIVDASHVRTEQKHLRLLVDNRPQIPDRTAFILGEGPSPVPMLQDSARQLQQWGAGMIAVACNTAHVFIEDIQNSVTVPVLNMLELLAEYISDKTEIGSQILLLTTTGALRSAIFEKYLHPYQLVIPDSDIQENIIMDIIYGEKGVKQAGNLAVNRRRITDVISGLISAGPSLIIAGCTELGILLDEFQGEAEMVNPLDCLAREIVRRAYGSEGK